MLITYLFVREILQTLLQPCVKVTCLTTSLLYHFECIHASTFDASCWSFMTKPLDRFKPFTTRQL